MLRLLMVLVLLMSLELLVLLMSLVWFWVSVLLVLLVKLVPVFLVILVLLMVGPCFVSEEGMHLGFFPLFRGPLFLPVYLGPALLVVCFGQVLTRALGFRLLADGGGGVGCRICCCCGYCVFIFLWGKFGNVADLFACPASWSTSFHHHHHLLVPADQSLEDGFKAISCQAQPEGVFPVGCPGRGLEEVKVLYLAKGA